jgi:hypothetical protein
VNGWCWWDMRERPDPDNYQTKDRLYFAENLMNDRKSIVLKV